MEFTHFDGEGNATMVDIGGKEITGRRAVAVGRIRMSPACFAMVEQGSMQKGDVLGVARIAGIQGTKQAGSLIPLCHQLQLSSSGITFTLHAAACEIEAACMVSCEGRTGAEMEALTGVSIALLTIYDMCKAVDKEMVISGIHLAEKQGGKSGDFRFGGRA